MKRLLILLFLTGISNLYGFERLAEQLAERLGSYINSCKDCSVDSNNVLKCNCQDMSGGWNNTSLQLPCNTQDIANCNGILTCGKCQ